MFLYSRAPLRQKKAENAGILPADSSRWVSCSNGNFGFIPKSRIDQSSLWRLPNGAVSVFDASESRLVKTPALNFPLPLRIQTVAPYRGQHSLDRTPRTCA